MKDLFELDSLINFFYENNCHLIAILYGDQKEVISFYLDKTPVSFPVFFDAYNDFYKNNLQGSDKTHHTLFVNSNGIVLQQGSLVYNKEERDRFLRKFKKLNSCSRKFQE